MKSEVTALLVVGALGLAGCFGETEQSAKTSTPKTAATKVQTKGKLAVSISGLEASGNDCNVRMKIHNDTGQKIRTFNMRNIEVHTQAGNVMVEYSDNYPLDVGATYTRGGIMVSGTSCKAITQIQVNETLCRYKVPMSEYERSNCVADVAYQSSRKIKFIQQ